MVKFTDLNGLELGSARNLQQAHHLQGHLRDGIKSCQLVMGFTLLASGSNWNTMPPHTHMRRSEIYFYFDVDPAHRIIHLMGPPDATRNLIMTDKTGGRLSGLVDPRRRRHQKLRLRLGHGRRKPGLRRHGPGPHHHPALTRLLVCHSRRESAFVFVCSCCHPERSEGPDEARITKAFRTLSASTFFVLLKGTASAVPQKPLKLCGFSR